MPCKHGLSHKIVWVGKSAQMFNLVANTNLKSKESRVRTDLSACRKRFTGSTKSCRTALPTQVDRCESTKAIGRRMFKELGKKARRNLWEMPCHTLIVWPLAKVYYATVYLKHRSLQNRKVKYRGLHLPSAGKSMMGNDDSQEFKFLFKAPVNGSSNYKVCS